jgi:hypothetical protein
LLCVRLGRRLYCAPDARHNLLNLAASIRSLRLAYGVG